MDKKKEKLSKMLIEKHKDIYKKLEDEPTPSMSVGKSLEQSLREMQLMREGKLPKKTISEVLEEIENE